MQFDIYGGGFATKRKFPAVQRPEPYEIVLHKPTVVTTTVVDAATGEPIPDFTVQFGWIFAGRDDVPRFLQGADVMLHPAYMESGGIVLIEALVAGLPVIATDVCGFGHYVEDSGGGVLIESPFAQQRLNEALQRMLTDAEYRKRCSENGVAFGRTADVYHMAERAADLIEARLGG